MEEFDYFDEPRRCSQCKVVTYCDRCPICGKLLPRTSHFAWKREYFRHVAGEEQIIQPKDHEVHRGHIKEREMVRPKIQVHPYKKEQEVSNKATAFHTAHMLKTKQTYRKASQATNKNTRKILIIFMIVIVYIVLFCVFVGLWD